MNVCVAANDNLRRNSESQVDTARVESLLIFCLLRNLLYLGKSNVEQHYHFLLHC